MNYKEIMVFKYLIIMVTLVQLSAIGQNIKPKLVVGIVVDQMRYDFLYRYQQNYSKNGFKRLLDQGFVADNMHYNYVPTYTGPGHSSIYTGTVPAIHGIAANNWIQNGTTEMYCSQDESVSTIGANNNSGKMSPKNLKTTTICDQLKLFYNQKSITAGISLKDRGAILPAGHLANEAYWYDGSTGSWLSSSFYMDQLPQWVSDFNAKKYPNLLLDNGWNLMLDKSKYGQASRDSVSWEESIGSPKKNNFPYTFSLNDRTKDIRVSPFGNTLTTLFAKQYIESTSIGRDDIPDFLAISYSSTDYVGHAFGPYSWESEDTYIRLDREIEELLNYLEAKIGLNNCLLFLTADHGVQDVPDYANSIKIPAGLYSENSQKKQYNDFLAKNLGIENIISKIQNEQIVLNQEVIRKNKITVEQICQELNNQDPATTNGIVGFYDFAHIVTAPLPQYLRDKLVNGYCPHRSGEIAILLEPNHISHGKKGTTHGSPYSHDSHVPFIMFGSSIEPKHTSTLYNITDIAPSLAHILGVLQPNGCIGKPMQDIKFKKK